MKITFPAFTSLRRTVATGRKLFTVVMLTALTIFAVHSFSVFAFGAPQHRAPSPAPTPLERALTLERNVNAGKLDEAHFTQTVSALLQLANAPNQAPRPGAQDTNRSTPDSTGTISDAFFVRALAHAAIAQWVGHANNGITVKLSAEFLTTANPPAWLAAYAAATYDEQIAYDWVRHLAVEGKLFSTDALRSEVLLYFARARRMGNPALEATLQTILIKMVDAGTDATACRALWLAARRALRPAALGYAGLAPDSNLLLYTRNAFHYKPNVCGVHVSWAYKPGGDILSVPLATGTARPLLRGRLGSGHVHGMDLWFDADRLVFAYAPQPVWPPAPQYELVWPKPERSNACYSHELRETMDPPHLYEIRDCSTGIDAIS